ncbi:MAG TPA: ThuA domain-containing protein [Actinomycetales bacterium]|nr:ThuA domain-containing protein [Actinomycetales bacterium]
MATERKVLVVRGGWEGHEPVAASDLFIPFLEANNFRVQVEDSLEVYADGQFMDSLDLIVQCWTMGEILPEELAGLRAAIEAGTGFAGWHGGVVDSFRMSSDYLQLMGAQFAAHPNDFVRHSVQIVPQQADHEIVAGMPQSFSLTTEQYWMLTDPLNEVLATTTIPAGESTPWDRDVISPVVWTRRWGEGKIFVSTIGHGVSDFAITQVRQITERGLLWAARSTRA